MLYLLCIGMFGVGVGHALHADARRSAAAHLSRRASPSPTSCARSPTRCCCAARCTSWAAGYWRGIAGGIGAAQDRAARRDRAVHVDVRRRHAGRRAHRRPGDRRRRDRLGADARPSCRSAGSSEGEPFRKITLPDRARAHHGCGDRRHRAGPARGAAAHRSRRAGPRPQVDDWKRVNTARLVLWVLAGARASSRPGTWCWASRWASWLFAVAAGLRVRAGQRHLARHQRLEPDLVGVRRHRRADGGARPRGPDRRPDGRHGAAGVDQRRLRHAAGPLDRLAPRHQPRAAVPLPGGRHRDGRGAGGRASPSCS